MKYLDNGGGERELRAVRDSAFDNRLRGQAFWHLKDEATKVMSKKVKWTELSEAVGVLDNGGRGHVMVNNGEDMWEWFRVDVKKRGTGSFTVPNYSHLADWGASREEADAIVTKVMGQLTLLNRE